MVRSLLSVNNGVGLSGSVVLDTVPVTRAHPTISAIVTPVMFYGFSTSMCFRIASNCTFFWSARAFRLATSRCGVGDDCLEILVVYKRLLHPHPIPCLLLSQALCISVPSNPGIFHLLVFDLRLVLFPPR